MTHSVDLKTPQGFDWMRLLCLAGRNNGDWVNRVHEASYVRLFTSGADLFLVRCRMDGGALRMTLESDGGLSPEETRVAELSRLVGHTFTLEGSWARVRAVLGRDPVLRRHVDAQADFRPLRTPSLFEALVDALLGQQIHRGLALRLRNRLVEDFGASRRYDGEVYYAFPTPARLARASVQLFRDCGLSARKAESLLGLARRFCRPVVLTGRPELDRSLLLRLPGIGPWSADYALIQGAAADDLIPLGDACLQTAIARLYGFAQIDEAKAEAIAEAWRPYRSWGAHLVWYGLVPETAEGAAR